MVNSRKVKEVWGKNPILFYIGIAIVLYLLYSFKQGTTNIITSVKDMFDTNEDGSDGFIDENEFNADEVASTFFNAMKDNFTDNETIYNTLKPLTPKQLALTFNAFGKRKYNSWFGISATFAGTDLNLLGWLKEEVGNNPITNWKDLCKTEWNKKISSPKWL